MGLRVEELEVLEVVCLVVFGVALLGLGGTGLVRLFALLAEALGVLLVTRGDDDGVRFVHPGGVSWLVLLLFDLGSGALRVRRLRIVPRFRPWRG